MPPSTPDPLAALLALSVAEREDAVTRLCESLASWNLLCVHTLRAFTGGRPDSAGHPPLPCAWRVFHRQYRRRGASDHR